MPEIKAVTVAELESRRILVTVEDRGTAKVLVIVCDEQRVEISSEPGPLLTAAGGFDELAAEALAIAHLLRARQAGEVAGFLSGPMGWGPRLDEVDGNDPPRSDAPPAEGVKP